MLKNCGLSDILYMPYRYKSIVYGKIGNAWNVLKLKNQQRNFQKISAKNCRFICLNTVHMSTHGLLQGL